LPAQLGFSGYNGGGQNSLPVIIKRGKCSSLSESIWIADGKNLSQIRFQRLNSIAVKTKSGVIEENPMHKTDIVVAVANKLELSPHKADLAVSAFIEQITNALSRGESVSLLGFGSFNVSERAARAGRNPQTGAVIQIAASKNVSFKPGKALKEAVND
jgi:nucleoid DNA-binding protein